MTDENVKNYKDELEKIEHELVCILPSRQYVIPEQTPVEIIPDTWEVLKRNADYEIYNSFPYPIRKIKKRHRYICESMNANGYYVLSIGCVFVRKHELIVEQWLPNPDPIHLTAIDHANRDPSDNHLDNLRWVTKPDNSRNRKGHKGSVKYEYVKELPENTIEVKKVNNWEFEDLHYCKTDHTFYTKVLDEYRKLIVLGKEGSQCVRAKDITKKQRAISLNIFNDEYKVIIE
jgi:hypothetical protein